RPLRPPRRQAGGRGPHHPRRPGHEQRTRRRHGRPLPQPAAERRPDLLAPGGARGGADCTMSTPAVLIATAKIRPGSEDAFAAWQGRHDAAVAAFPGFNSSDIVPPGERDDTWTILLNFDSREHL